MSVEDLEIGVGEQCAHCRARCTSVTRAVTASTCIVTLVATAVVGALLLRTGTDIRQCTQLINNMQHDLRNAHYKISNLETGLKNIQIKGTLTDLKHKIVSEQSDRSDVLLNELLVAINDDRESGSAEVSDKEYDNRAVPSSISVKSPKNNDSPDHVREPFSAEKTGYDVPKKMLSRLLLLRQKRSDEVTSAIHPLFRDPSASNTRRRPREADSNGTQTKRPKVNQGKGGTEKVQGKKKKQLQMRLSAIQLVGGGPVSPRHDKTDLKGLWHLDWATPDGVFKEYLQANTHGGIHIAKSGVYLMYAQITLTHQNKIGYNVLKGTKGQQEILSTCTHITSYVRPTSETMDDKPDPASCTTIKIVQLIENDRVFIEEIPSNTAANYSKTTSFFGLIKIDDI